MMSNGKEHAWQRKMLNPAFSYANLKGMVPFMKTAADDLVQVRVKGVLSRIFSISLNSQNKYLCRRKPTNNGQFLLTIAVLVIVR